MLVTSLRKNFALLFLGISWCLASPIGSASDDNFHLSSIWCSHGIESGRCEESSINDQLKVPTAVANAGRCYLTDQEQSGACVNEELRATRGGMIPTSRLATNGFLNGNESLFYWTNGFLVGTNIEKSVVTMRLLNLGLLFGLLFITSRSRSKDQFGRLQIVLLTVGIPVGLWTIFSTSSSAWTFLGALFFWYFIDALVCESSRGERAWSILGVFLCTLLAIGSRAESIAMLLVQGVSFVALRARVNSSTKPNKLQAASLLLLTALLLTSVYISGVWRMLGSGFAYVLDDTPVIRDSSWVFVYNLQAVIDLYTYAVSAIGVLTVADFQMYKIVGTINIGVIAVLMIVYLRGASRRASTLLLLNIVVAILVPLVMLQQTNLHVGEELLPRYLMPLLILVVAFGLFQADSKPRLSRGQAITLGAGLSVTHLVALRQVILRFTHGIDQYGVVNLNVNREWWWELPGIPSPMWVWLLGSGAFAYLAMAAFCDFSYPHIADKVST